MRIALVICSLFLFGCQTVQPVAVSMGLSAIPNPFDQQKAAGAYETYYGVFPDVPLPRDMKVDDDSTLHSKTSQGDTGFLLLTGNVEPNSLLTAQALTLTRDGWKVIAFFRDTHSMIAAQKGERICVVTLGESLTVTYMMIWVTSRSEGFRPPFSRYSTPAEIRSASGKTSEPQENAPVNTLPANTPAPAGEVGESELTS